MRTLRQLVRSTRASAAVEAAMFLPIFMLLTFGVTDLGSAMFKRQQINAAAQAGAAYAVKNSGSGSVCEILTSDCLSGIQAAMNAAAGNASFCSGSVCTATITDCADGSPKCIIVSAHYPLTPILPSIIYSWAQTLIASSTVTIRIL